jgi:TetR/AcrR family transcriptional repressor of nem operon
MAEAGLTNGGFYSHFRSKSDLVREGLERALDEQLRRLAEGDATLGQLRELIRSYLSAEHRDRPHAGCASVALLPEIGRQPRAARKAYTDRMREFFEQLVRRMPQNSSSRTSHDTAMGIFAVLVGALQLARAVEDPLDVRCDTCGRRSCGKHARGYPSPVYPTA